jgi:hypothetical protein
MRVTFERPDGDGIGIVAVVGGKRIPLRNHTQLMAVRRFCHQWEDKDGKPVPDKDVYHSLVNAVGHYV